MKKNNLIKIFCLSIIFICVFFLFIDDPVGMLSILLIVFLSLILINKYPSIANLLITALAIRIIVLFLGNIIDLPDSGKDAVYFENIAFKFSQDGFYRVFTDHYTGANSKFICWIIAIFYSLFGRSLLMAQSLSLFFGMGSVFLGWVIAKKLWGNQKAIKVGWILSLFPSLVLYSVLTMREVYISFFLLVAVLGVINWSRDGRFRSIILAMFGFIGAYHFHGAMIIGGIVFLIIVGLITLNRFIKSLLLRKINFKNFITFIMIFIISVLYFSNQIGAAKIGTFEESINLSRLTKIMESSGRGDASYPDWLKIDSVVEYSYKGPVRAIYFIFSPFPWDIKKTSHLIGTFDSFLYMIIFYFILKNRKIILKDPGLRIVLLILISYFFVFGIGVGNFGTSIRHRAKFVMALILMAGPFFPKFKYSLKRKSSSYL